ncbi:ribosomal RNA small subunit methyltransferase A [Nocardia fusca]|uniref:ribosomal RNA small subunit methyltransferase A n=1 Tax=Nocardia fusca TaxID=941183 RepID=UPI0037C80F1D
MAHDFAYRNYSHTQGKVKNGGGDRSPRDQGRRTLSRNFLVDPAAVDLVMAVADPGGLVLEPEAGDGSITRALARRGASVTAYEIDPLSAAKLTARNRSDSGVRVVRADVTKTRAPREPFAVVGNISFSVTAKIVDWCLAAPTLTSATLLTQLDYARWHSGDHGRWSPVTVANWPWFDWELCGQVGRESFRPVPSVDSAVLRIRRRPEPLVRELDSYVELVETGFSGMGGSVRASLRTCYDGVDAALAVAGIDRDTVVDHVHPDQWVQVHKRLIS